eukprot:snap_masked-scaffold_3-processed-gene-9.37-mRNA-1 protein AED:0.20 eAED:1.00 QI:0/0/0/1/1/1/2/0/239
MNKLLCFSPDVTLNRAYVEEASLRFNQDDIVVIIPPKHAPRVHFDNFPLLICELKKMYDDIKSVETCSNYPSVRTILCAPFVFLFYLFADCYIFLAAFLGCSFCWYFYSLIENSLSIDLYTRRQVISSGCIVLSNAIFFYKSPMPRVVSPELTCVWRRKCLERCPLFDEDIVTFLPPSTPYRNLILLGSTEMKYANSDYFFKITGIYRVNFGNDIAYLTPAELEIVKDVIRKIDPVEEV